MVKKFRRPAAGIEEQIPSDLRPPEVLRKTLDYLVDDIVGDAESSDASMSSDSYEKLKGVHNFVWDRTRSIRNDFSVQQIKDVPNLKIAINCFERMVRFHILTRHQLGGRTNTGEGYDHQQDLEQCIKALVSLITYYDLARSKGCISPNEPEFRAYWIITRIPEGREQEVESKVQKWPKDLQCHPRVVKAIELYAAGCNALNPRTRVQAIAQASYMKFWNIVSSSAVSYLMACAAEIFFDIVRKCALFCIASGYSRGRGRKVDEWTLTDLMKPLALDTEDEVFEYVEAHGLDFFEHEEGVWYLDLSSTKGISYFQIASIRPPKTQYFSYDMVEIKRLGRTFPAIINGYTFKEALAKGLVREGDTIDADMNEDYQELEADIETQSQKPKYEMPAEVTESKGAQFAATTNDDASTLFVGNGEQNTQTLPFPDQPSVAVQPQANNLNPAASTFNPFAPTGATSSLHASGNPFSAFKAATVNTNPEPKPSGLNPFASKPISGSNEGPDTSGTSVFASKALSGSDTPSRSIGESIFKSKALDGLGATSNTGDSDFASLGSKKTTSSSLLSNPFAKFGEKIAGPASTEEAEGKMPTMFSTSPFVQLGEKGTNDVPKEETDSRQTVTFSPSTSTAFLPTKPNASLPADSSNSKVSVFEFGPSIFSKSVKADSDDGLSSSPQFSTGQSSVPDLFPSPSTFSPYLASSTSAPESASMANASVEAPLEPAIPQSLGLPNFQASPPVLQPSTQAPPLSVFNFAKPPVATPSPESGKRVTFGDTPTKDSPVISNATTAPKPLFDLPKSILKTSTGQPQASLTPSPPVKPRSSQQKSTGPTPRQQRRADCMDYLARQLLLDPKDGILYQYIAFVLDPIFNEVKSQVDLEKDVEKADAFRRNNLIRKYGSTLR